MKTPVHVIASAAKYCLSPSPLMGEGWGGGDDSAKSDVSAIPLEAAASPPPKSSPIKGEDFPHNGGQTHLIAPLRFSKFQLSI